MKSKKPAKSASSSRNQALRKSCFIEPLEVRRLLSVNMLSYRNDNASTGVNPNEVQLTPANVKVGSFGKIFSTQLDGQVYTQPLVDTGITIGAGVNTSAGATGVHDAVFVATENDTLYAINSAVNGGGILWTRSFLSNNNPGSGTGVLGDQNNTLNSTAIVAVPNGDLGSSDITPTIGITGTPVIDPATGILYVSVKTKETISGATWYVQRLHAINVADGTDAVAPYLIGATTNGNTNNTPIYVYGSGDGSITDPYNGTGKKVVQFNALREAQRQALSLVNNTLYVTWASHGDNGPYHGKIVAWDVSKITTSGFQLKGVLDTAPNNGQSGIWGGGGQLAFESDGSAFYFMTGNGSNGNPVLGSNGLPTDGNYHEAVVKAQLDPTTSPTNQNTNGWGIKVDDFFIPYNVQALDAADSDFGSGSPLLLPDSAGITGHQHLLIAGGKDGRLYVLDRNNLGGFNSVNDNVINAVPNGSGHNTPPNAVSGTLSTPAFFNGKIYSLSGYSGRAYSFTVGSNGQLTATSQTSISTFGSLPGSPVISANGTTNGIVWLMDRNTNELHAYDAGSLATELWNSAQAAGGADNLGAVVKFASPTVVNGEVFVGTAAGLVAYGLTPPAGSVSKAPVLAATPLSGSSINLTWTDPSQAPNTASSYLIEESTDANPTFSQITTAPAGSTSIAIGGLSPLTKYYFRIRGSNGVGYSLYSNTANATTTNQSTAVDFSGGFAGAAGKIALNGSAAINGAALQLTDTGLNEAGSAYASTPLDITNFSSQFTFQLTSGSGTADGFTFALQGTGPTALGTNGGELGYFGIQKSIAVKFDLYSNTGEGSNSTGLFTNGADPTSTGSIDLTSSGIDLHSGHIFRVNLTYNGTNLSVTITDTQTAASATQNYAVNIPAIIGSGTAYAGFTGGTGGLSAVQDILTWTYSPTATSSPNAPTALGGNPASATSVALNWSNNAANQTGYHLDRATDAAFTQNLITENLPANPASFTDSAAGLAPGSTFYYRIRAFNAAGDSGNSNPATITIPLAPPKPTAQSITDVSSTEIDMTWTDNAGHLADGYQILRAINHGNFSLVETLPPTSRTAPSEYDWADTNLSPGNYYEYHIEAYNVSGNNDFAGVNAITLTLPPSGVTATAGQNVVNLAWTAPTGAVSYNIYRGSTPGGESLTPIATNVTTTSYPDNTAINGNTYYYYVTAINGNGAGLPTESAPSSEVHASAGTITGSVAGSFAAAAASYNLTTLGTSDWAHWGRAGNAGNFDHKASGGSQISNVTAVGSGANTGGYSNTIRSATWTDGTPTASDTNESGFIYSNGALNSGVSFTVPADTTTRTLTVYAGGADTTSSLTAHLSDGSAADYTVSTGQRGVYSNVYTIVYHAASAGQTLKITLLKTANLAGPTSSADLIAAWLSGAPAGDTVKPTATLQATSSITASNSAETLKVVYIDNVAVKASTLATGNLVLSGPTAQTATFVSASPSTDNATITATYSVAAPAGGWTTAANGTYNVSLAAGSVSDTNSNFAATAALGLFQIAIPGPDVTPPQASLQTPLNLTASNSAETLQVVYTDNVAVKASTLATGNIVLSGPTSQTATFVSSSPSTDNATITATYSVAAPAGGWTTAANGAYNVSLAASSVSDTNSNFAATAPLGAFQIAISAPGAGSVSGQFAAAAASYNLTTLGTSDWAHWGRGGNAGNFDHKATGGSQISNVSNVGTGANTGGYSNTSRISTWTDGTPTVSDANESGFIYSNGALNSGVSFTVPADTTTRTLTVYAGGADTTSSLTAHLSDGSAADYTVSTGQRGVYSNVYTIVYHAASAGQTLKITLLKTANLAGPTSSADLIAAWLSGAPAGDTAKPTAALQSVAAVTAFDTVVNLTVTYTDNAAVKASTLATGNLVLSGPTSQIATFVSASPSTDNATITATYSITPPFGGWTIAQNGNYTVSLAPNSVSDSSSNFASAVSLGGFQIAMPDSGGASLLVTSGATTASYNLTTAGTSDWAHWGRGGQTGTFDHKSSGGSQISDVTTVGTGGNSIASSDPSRTVSWSDGTPTATDSNEHGYIASNGALNTGYSFTAPADTTIRTLTVYGGGSNSTFLLTAHLSDGSTSDYLVSGGQANLYTNQFTLTYRAASAGQTLTVTLIKTANLNGHTDGSADLIAAYLVGAPAGDTTKPTATLQATSSITASNSAETLKVVYTDNVAVKASTLATGNLVLSGPTAQTATFVSASPSTDNATITATYSVAAPAGGWTTAANGTYNVSLAVSSVSDTNSNFAATAQLGSFQVAIPAPGAGSLSATQTTPAASYNLTTLGTSDWTHWGRGNNYANFDHKASGGSQISNVTVLGSGNVGSWYDASRSVNWSDGAPTSANGGDSAYIWANNAIGAGYSFTAPADTTTRTLYIYAGGNSSGATLTAHLSDGSAADVVLTASGNGLYTNFYTITYKAASAGQKLTISYVKSTNINGAGGSVDLIAAALA